jgi:hypothetical protein
MPYKKTCPICGQSFDAEKKTAVYDSDKCRQRAHRRRLAVDATVAQLDQKRLESLAAPLPEAHRGFLKIVNDLAETVDVNVFELVLNWGWDMLEEFDGIWKRWAAAREAEMKQAMAQYLERHAPR